MAHTHSDETKAAVLAALLAGQSVSEVARTYHVTRASIQRWRTQSGLDRPADASLIDQQKKDRIVELVLCYLAENLCTLAQQQEHFRDRAWLARQSAADLAVLHGVCADKAFRLLGALQFDPPDESPAGAAVATPEATAAVWDDRGF